MTVYADNKDDPYITIPDEVMLIHLSLSSPILSYIAEGEIKVVGIRKFLPLKRFYSHL